MSIQFNFTFFSDFANFFMRAAEFLMNFVFSVGGSILMGLISMIYQAIGFFGSIFGLNMSSFYADFDSVVAVMQGNAAYGILVVAMFGMAAFFLLKILLLIKNIVFNWI